MTEGKLSAYYHECSLCSNSTLVAHASNGSVFVYNSTSEEAWKGQSYSVETNALESSELSFQPYSTTTYSTTTYADQVNLYYQRSDKTLVLSSWFSWQYQSDSENLSPLLARTMLIIWISPAQTDGRLPEV